MHKKPYVLVERMQAKPLPLPALDLQWSSRLWTVCVCDPKTFPFSSNGKIGDGRGGEEEKGRRRSGEGRERKSKRGAKSGCQGCSKQD